MSLEARILIVDDDSAIREAMCEFMERSGFRAFTAASGEDALNSLADNKFQVVITDIIMPGMDGLELTGMITSRYDVDVIVMTGYSGDYSYEEAINRGASDFVFKPVRFEELALRIRRVMRERTLTNERAHMLEELQTLAITDGLTRLYNSRHFYNQLDLEVDRCRRYEHALSLLLLDIDLFKQYNDTYGHLEGDKVLQRIGGIIRSCLRTMDSAYRYGGEEFTIILPETAAAHALTVAERIRVAIEEETFHPTTGKTVSITISAGVTEYHHGEELADLVQRADQAMYMSKDGGRNRVSLLYPE